MDLQRLEAKETLSPQAEALIHQIKERSRNLFQSRQLLCTEAVVMALNHGLDGGLTDSQVIAMAAPYSLALGDSGCICGALSGAIMVSGLFLGKDEAYRHRREIRESARQLHDAFKSANGSACCRTLTRKIRHDKAAHFHQCAGFTAEAAAMAARLVLQKRPELLHRANDEYLSRRQSMIGGAWVRLLHCLLGRGHLRPAK